MGILGMLIRGTIEAVQNKRAKNDLEGKLGRSVTKEEQYSLGSHLQAAQPNVQNAPMISTPRESSTPFADAKPPMKTLTKLLLIGIPLLLIGGLFVTFLFLSMSERTYNRLNPYTPKPPEGVFPADVGGFKMEQKPDYNKPTTYKPATWFNGEYKKDAGTVRYNVSVYNSEAETADAYNKIKDSIKDSDHGKVVEKGDNRIAFAALSGWNSYVYFKDGKYLKTIDSYNQKDALDFEGFLKNQPPQAITMLNEAELKQNALGTKSDVVTVLQLLDDYKKDDAAADKKYKDKVIKIAGKVEFSDRDKAGQWMIGFLRPGATKATDGMVVASFEKAKELPVTALKKGDNVTLQCKVSMNLYVSIMLENCSKL